VVVLGIIASLFAYAWRSSSFNLLEVIAAFLFWYGVAVSLISFPLRAAAVDFTRYVRTVLGASVFVVYLLVHVLIYGFLLEDLLSFTGRYSYTAALGASVSTTLLTPPSAVNALLALWYNPWITITFPPIFSTALSLYSLVIAVLIDVLIVANIGRTRELGRASSKGAGSRATVLLPALGVALGASCCLSVPLLLSVVVPSTAVIASATWTYWVTYFLFPPFAIFILCTNLYAVNRLTTSRQA